MENGSEGEVKGSKQGVLLHVVLNSLIIGGRQHLFLQIKNDFNRDVVELDPRIAFENQNILLLVQSNISKQFSGLESFDEMGNFLFFLFLIHFVFHEGHL